ncbi:hypothetical protein J4E89_003471 [Alternaria sp. Ai002NY15]|nr:hypothetical protein J4E89_003471 [Alternaria sp. Ai002NY15]
MSSIKQVQDLQSQIAELTHVNSQLRTKVSDGEPSDPERTDTKRRLSEAQIGAIPGPRPITMPALNNFDQVRSNIRTHAQGIFPTPHHDPKGAGLTNWRSPEIPIRADFAYLARSYMETIHESYPAVHWPTFQREVDEVYTSKTFEGCSREWVGLFFAVLACGALQAEPGHTNSPTSVSKGQAMYETATAVLQSWPHDVSVTYAQAALLLSIYATECNLGPAGSMWLASAARMAQELQICPEVDVWPLVDGEIRRRLWWSIYVRDRIMSLETGKPMIINEIDCEISLPSAVDDRYIQPNSSFRSLAKPTHYTGFMANIHITRLYAPLRQILKSSVVLPQSLQSFDEELRLKLLLLPEAYQPDSNTLFDMSALPTIFCLLSARFSVYRRNLTPVAGLAERVSALKRCFSVSQDTATAIGNRRKVNTACGKHVVFFLERMFDRVRTGRASSHQLEQDEEMIAYVSADAQSSLEHSWVWAGDNLISSSMKPDPTPIATRSPSGDEPMRDALPLRTSSGSPMNTTTEPDEWSKVEQMVKQLMDELLHRSTQSPAYYPPPHNPVKRVQLAPEAPPPPKMAPNPSPTPSGTSRISIANII